MVPIIKFASHVMSQYQLSRANQWYTGYWIEGVVGEAYHKIQIVSCASAKITLNDGISA